MFDAAQESQTRAHGRDNVKAQLGTLRASGLSGVEESAGMLHARLQVILERLSDKANRIIGYSEESEKTLTYSGEGPLPSLSSMLDQCTSVVCSIEYQLDRL